MSVVLAPLVAAGHQHQDAVPATNIPQNFAVMPAQLMLMQVLTEDMLEWLVDSEKYQRYYSHKVTECLLNSRPAKASLPM